MPVTPYMGLSLPTPGTSVPDWAAILNTAFSLLDSHDHTAGHGIQVPSAGVNINADLTFNGWNLTQARTLRLQQLAAAPALAQDAGAIYATTAGDLWWNNGAGQHIQITSGTALAASSLGGISGLGGTTAGAAYSNSTKTFAFTQAANQSALLDAGPLIIHDTAASALGITLQSPVGLAGAYALTLPTALPASTQFLTVSSTGTILYTGIVPPVLAFTGTAVAAGLVLIPGNNGSGSGVLQVVPMPACTLRNMRFTFALAGYETTAGTVTFTVFKSGVATALAVSVAASTLTASDLTHSVSFAAGDTLNIQMSGNPTGGQYFGITLEMAP